MPNFKVGQIVDWTPSTLWTGVVTHVSSDAVVVLWSHPFLPVRKEPTTHKSSEFLLIKILSDPILESPPEDGEWE